MAEDKASFVEQAKLSEQAERFDDMVEAMKKVTSFNEDLLVDERNLLSVAYKNVVGSRRSSLRVVEGLLNKTSPDSPKYEQAEEYMKKIREELLKLCDEVLKLLEESLIPNAKQSANQESEVFYLKMRGDYNRYLVEAYGATDEGNEYKKKSRKAYEEATVVSEAHLPSPHPIRLGLALNFSVFYYEIESNVAEACKLAKSAFDKAITELDQVQEDTYKDSTLIMQLLRDNLTLWKNEDMEDAAGDAGDADQQQGDADQQQGDAADKE